MPVSKLSSLPGARRPKSIRRRAVITLLTTTMVDRAARMDREADVALSHGHHVRAERLAWRAAELRGWI